MIPKKWTFKPAKRMLHGGVSGMGSTNLAAEVTDENDEKRICAADGDAFSEEWNERARLIAQAPALYHCLKDLVKCIRDFQLGDYSPLMDEIFDAEHAIREADGTPHPYES